MLSGSLLLRLLLAVAIVVGGIGNVHALTRMALEQDTQVGRSAAMATMPAGATAAGHGCHGMEMDSQGAAQGTTTGADHSGLDCCEGGVCLSACLHAGVAMMPPVSVMGMSGPHASVSFAPASAPVSPLLPSPQRPPIG